MIHEQAAELLPRQDAQHTLLATIERDVVPLMLMNDRDPVGPLLDAQQRRGAEREMLVERPARRVGVVRSHHQQITSEPARGTAEPHLVGP